MDLRVAVCTLPGVDAILGTDAKELSSLLRRGLDQESSCPPDPSKFVDALPYCALATSTDLDQSDETTDPVEDELPPTATPTCWLANDPEEQEDDGLPQFDDDLFLQFSTRKTKERNQKKQRQYHSQAWGQPVPLEGGRPQLLQAQASDKSLEIC